MRFLLHPNSLSLGAEIFTIWCTHEWTKLSKAQPSVIHRPVQKLLTITTHYFSNSSHGPGVNTYLNDSIMDLKIGTYDNIEVATEETTIIAALHKFLNKKISALPIVDCSGVLIDIYSKFDVINLAAENTYSNLDISLKMANERRAVFFDGVHSCRGRLVETK